MDPKDDEKPSKGYVLSGNNRPALYPMPQADTQDNPAANVIRQKLDALYDAEPNAKEERQLASHADKPLSKHQSYMQSLSASGLTLAEIQTKWHEYYQALSDPEKHEVWQEFYAEHNRQQAQPVAPTHQAELPHKKDKPSKPVVHHHSPERDTRSVADIKRQIQSQVAKRTPAKLHPHLQSLAFGLGMGGLTILILLFSFFNERIIAPLITPSRTVSSTPIIVDANTPVTDPVPKIIIPKINVEIPVVYDEPSIEEDAVQAALERGVVHYATTPLPGEQGNAAIFGHSSNNILNKGKYKFAFVLLNRLENGDLFYLTRNNVRYVYKVYEKKVVSPSEVSVLGSTGKPATVTLITCDPPGSTKNRLIVIGEQITPDPAANVASSATQAETPPVTVPGDPESLWQRITNWF